MRKFVEGRGTPGKFKVTAQWFFLLSDLRHAAVRKKFNAVDEAAVVRREKYNYLGDFIRCADATKRDGGDLEVHETLHLLLSQSHQIVTRSGHDARTDALSQIGRSLSRYGEARHQVVHTDFVVMDFVSAVEPVGESSVSQSSAPRSLVTNRSKKVRRIAPIVSDDDADQHAHAGIDSPAAKTS